MKYAKPERIPLVGHPELNEKWVQDRIAEDPSLLGLGDIVLRDRERAQPRAGRLDLLCQDAETNRRYEIEIQLGKSDESHIIRTIEYWDIERKRYPQYDHTAVIVAETITARFLNVISLFNGFIPLIAIQVQALKVGDQVSLVFTTVLNELRLGPTEEDEEVREVTDRAYWEKRATKTTLEMTDALVALVRQIDPSLTPKYNKFYVGLARDGKPNNFVVFKPKKGWLRLEVYLNRAADLDSRLDEAGLDVAEYDARRGRYGIRLAEGDVRRHEKLLQEILARSHAEALGPASE